MIKSKFSMAFAIFLLLAACAEKDTTFLITETSVGPLQTNSASEALAQLFVGDSIVRDTSSSKLIASKKIQIFETGGNKLLSLTPKQDSSLTIGNIQIHDERYQTASGIGLGSTFGDIQSTLGIKKIVTTFNSIVVFPKNGPLYFTIDKDQLPANLRYSNSRIEAVQVPETAKIKFLMVGWD
ncbi:hypothetical protein ABV409_12925 [Flagellimonas sp. DF-77]|uniref:hypothetical protein n=1 Tax=Flagellimonas algarum TaxID=3230298 RepID=UPI0033972CB2